MNNRRREASDAVAFAEAMAEAAASGAEQENQRLLKVLQDYRRRDVLAIVPTSAMDLRQHYADLIAEHVVASGDAGQGGDPFQQVDDHAREKFTALLGGEGNKYAAHAASACRTHALYCRFAEAAAAYALLKPGRKSAADAEPSEEAILAAMERERRVEKAVTFDVYSNMVSPVERYARALCRPAQEALERVRIPITLLSCASAEESDDADGSAAGSKKAIRSEEIALAAMLYYRYRPDAVDGKYTDHYPIAVREIGAYLAERDQAKAVGRLMLKPRLLRFQELYFAGRGDQERRLMVALKKWVVDEFKCCNKPEARANAYMEVELTAPRALVNGIRNEIGRGAQARRLLTSFLTRNSGSADYVPWEDEKAVLLEVLKDQLNTYLKDIPAKGCRGMSESRQKPFDRARDTGACVMKLCMSACFVKSRDDAWDDQSVGLDDLRNVLNQEQDEVFQDLESARARVFDGHMRMSYGWRKRETAFRCSLGD